MLNKVICAGRIARYLDLRRTQSGVAVCSFTIACDRDFKAQDGSKETDWINVVAWRNQAEFLSRFGGKGRMVIVEGRLQSRKWTDKNGNTRETVEIQAENVYFADSKQSNGGSQNKGVEAQETADTGVQFEDVEDFNEGSLPF